MKRLLALVAAGVCANALVAFAALAQATPEVTLTRFADCGTQQAPTPVNQRFSDTFAFGDLKIQFVFSCYLIKHGDDYMLWDTGHAMTAPNVAPKVSLVDQLAQLKLTPDQIKYVGISHYHGDHVGQANSFPKSTLLMLVAAFAGLDFVLKAYRAAIADRYRFFSYGDAMLIL